jgi:hypothetical protein
VQTLPTAASVESKLLGYLKGELTSKDLTVTGGVTIKTRLSHLASGPSPEDLRRDQDFYLETVRLIEASDDPEVSFLSQVERRVINLTKNWILPGRTANYDLLEEPQFRSIQGKVAGFAGPFLLVEDRIVDTDLLAGYVVKDNGTKFSQS